jgi:hypothetical protein
MMIRIDDKIWCTPAVYAKERLIPVKTISAWITRDLIEYKKYPQLNNLVLVKRGSEIVREYGKVKKKKKIQ